MRFAALFLILGLTLAACPLAPDNPTTLVTRPEPDRCPFADERDCFPKPPKPKPVNPEPFGGCGPETGGGSVI